MHRILFSLIVALVLSPIGAMAHANQHFDSGHGDPFHANHEAGVPCGLCAAFVTLEQAAPGSQAQPLQVGNAVPPALEALQGIVVRSFFYFFQRTPPAFL